MYSHSERVSSGNPSFRVAYTPTQAHEVGLLDATGVNAGLRQRDHQSNRPESAPCERYVI